jgi:hypothetical protein
MHNTTQQHRAGNHQRMLYLTGQHNICNQQMVHIARICKPLKIPRYRFLGSLNVYKYELCTETCVQNLSETFRIRIGSGSMQAKIVPKKRKKIKKSCFEGLCARLAASPGAQNVLCMG